MKTNKALSIRSVVVAILVGSAASQVNAAGTAYFVPAAPSRPPSQDQNKVSDDEAELNVLNNAASAPSPEDKARREFLEQRIKDKTTPSPAMLRDQALQREGNTGGGTVSTPPIPNSKSNYKRDKLEWSTPIHAYRMDTSGAVDLNTVYCWPAGPRLIGRDSEFTTASIAPKSDQAAPAKSDADNYLPTMPDAKIDVYLQKDGKTDCLNDDDLGSKVTLTTTTPIAVSQKDAEAAAREGLDFGTLVVPFKFQLSDQTAITSSATLGGYLGYRIPWRVAGLDFRLLAFGGVSEVPTSEADSSGKITSQTVAGLSYGAGLVTTVKDNFNVGLVIGFDHVNSVQDYKYQDKPWISLEIGYSFTE